MKKAFNENMNTAVFTTKSILEKGSPILVVFHYAEDGAWQFSGEEECIESDFKVISLEEMINIDNSILEIADLPLGYFASRKSKNENWIIEMHKE
jgi:hypothetical protein